MKNYNQQNKDKIYYLDSYKKVSMNSSISEENASEDQS